MTVKNHTKPTVAFVRSASLSRKKSMISGMIGFVIVPIPCKDRLLIVRVVENAVISVTPIIAPKNMRTPCWRERSNTELKEMASE